MPRRLGCRPRPGGSAQADTTAQSGALALVSLTRSALRRRRARRAASRAAGQASVSTDRQSLSRSKQPGNRTCKRLRAKCRRDDRETALRDGLVAPSLLGSLAADAESVGDLGQGVSDSVEAGATGDVVGAG